MASQSCVVAKLCSKIRIAIALAYIFILSGPKNYLSSIKIELSMQWEKEVSKKIIQELIWSSLGFQLMLRRELLFFGVCVFELNTISGRDHL